MCVLVHQKFGNQRTSNDQDCMYLQTSPDVAQLAFHHTRKLHLSVGTFTDRLTPHPHRRQRQGQPHPSWWSSLSGPSRSQRVSCWVVRHPRHRQSRQAPLHRLRSPPRPRGHLLLHPHPPQRPWPWCAWSSSWVLQRVRWCFAQDTVRCLRGASASESSSSSKLEPSDSAYLFV